MTERPEASGDPTPQESPSDRLSTLFHTHGDRLYRVARRLVPSTQDALDLVQDTFVKAAGALRSVPVGASSEEAWLVRVLVNIRRDQWRKETVRRRYENDLRHSTPTHDRSDEAALARAAVWSALDRLAPRRRAIVVLHEIEGCSTASIASLLGISTITVRWHLSRGRRELARQLESQLGDTHEQPQTSLAGGGSAPPRASTL